MDLVSISGVLYRRKVSSDSVISTNAVSRSHATHSCNCIVVDDSLAPRGRTKEAADVRAESARSLSRYRPSALVAASRSFKRIETLDNEDTTGALRIHPHYTNVVLLWCVGWRHHASKRSVTNRLIGLPLMARMACVWREHRDGRRSTNPDAAAASLAGRLGTVMLGHRSLSGSQSAPA